MGHVLTADEVLTTTRSVRRRLDLARDVPMELIRECLEIALQAPSGSNKQSWHWIVVTDPELRASIGELYRRAWEGYTSSSVSAAAVTGDGGRVATQARVMDSASHLAEVIGDVPVHVLACIRASRLPSGNQATLWGSILPAAWSFQLAARARGLGSAWTTMNIAFEDELRALLNIPDDVHQGVLLPTAYYLGDSFRPAPRLPLDDVLHVDRW